MSEHLFTSLRTRAAGFWVRSTEPFPSVQGEEARRQSHQQASLLLGIFIAMLALTVANVVLNPPDRDIRLTASLTGAIFILTVYQISRRGYYQLANIIAGLYTTLAVLIVALWVSGPVGVSGLYYLLTLTVFSAFFMRLRVAVVILVMHGIGMLLLPLTGRVRFEDVLIGPFVFNLFLGSLILLMAYHWKRLQAERQARLAESEDRDNIITRMISDYAFSFWVKPDNSLELDWITEDSFERVTGYTAGDVRRGGNVFVFKGEDLEAVQQEWARTLQGESTGSERQFIRRDGRVGWLYIIRHPVWDEHHTRVVRVYGIAQDITKRKEAELALRQSEERHRMISESISDYAFSFLVAPDGTMTADWVTDSIIQITGYTVEEIRSMKNTPNLGLYHPDDTARVMDDLKEVLENVPVESEYRIITKAGEPRWISIHRRPVWNEAEQRVVSFYGVAKDITARKQAETALRESEERYRIIIELMSDYTFSYFINPDGTLALNWVSEEAFTRDTGFTAEDLRNGGSFAFHPDDLAYALEMTARTVRGEPTESEHRIIAKDGRIIWAYFRRQPVWSEEEGRYTLYYAIAKDITARKQAEAALRESEERYRVITGLMSDYAFAFWVEPDNTLKLDWITDSALQHVLGFTEEDIRANGAFIGFASKDKGSAYTAWQRTIAGEVTEGEHEAVTKSGEVRWIHSYRYPVWDEEHKRVVRIYGVVKDITERKRAEIALRESEERYRVITELMSDFAFSYRMNPDKSINLNWITEDSFHRVTGYVAADLANGGRFAFHPDDSESVSDEMERTHRGEPTEGIHRIFTKSGDIRWIHLSRLPIWDEAEQRYTHYYGVVEDITQRKLAEMAQQESQERYRAISELISDYAYSCAVMPDGRLPMEWVTDSVFRVIGYTAEEVLADPNFTCLHPDDEQRSRADKAKVLTGTTTDSEYQFFTKQGDLRWMRVYRRPVWSESEGRVVRIYAIVQDITERKRADIALRESEERYRIISEMISDYAFSIRVEPDGSLKSEWLTDSVKGMLGYTAAEVVSTPNFSSYHPDDEAMARADVEKVMRGIPTDNEYRSITKNGETRWTRMFRRPVWDDDHQRVIRFYAVAQDITQHKQAEIQKIRLSLEQERLTMVNQFVEAFSHDVRTSLATIETSRYLIERITAETKHVQLPAQLNKIHHSVNHLSEQLSNLHMVSSLADPNPIPCQVNRLIDSLIAEHSLRARQKKQTLRFEPEPDLAVVQVDEAKLRQAVQHLLLNALAHTSEGGQITLRTYQQNQHIMIEVRDTGVGIETDKLAQIFEPFYKTDLSRHLEAGGMGLGLSIVNMIVQAHKGRISVESQPGEGSVFTIALPIKSASEAAAQQPA